MLDVATYHMVDKMAMAEGRIHGQDLDQAERPDGPHLPPLASALAGRRILVTGATGFLGTALVERLLRSVPGCSVAVLVRPGRRTTAASRTEREILRNDCFDRLREELGEGFSEMTARRVTPVSGDVGTDGLGLDEEGRAVLASCDVVVHCAAAVAFDAPLDTAVEVNLLGPSRVAAAITEQAAARREDHPGSSPTHLISVSTAYVAGTHQGEATETLSTDPQLSGARARTHTTVTTEVDIDAEISFARRLRADLEAESRRNELLERFTKKARTELGAAGTHLLAERAEKLREEWVREQLVDAGRSRAKALGWPDAYAFTKALGERRLVMSHPGVATTVVRPSIIESALSEPRPGWIRGFRMAEPIIISYARGLLKEFPGIPEGVTDVIPVDLVTAALIAVAAEGPDPSGPAVYHVASSVRNPLRYGDLVELVQAWFNEHPLYDSKGSPILVPEWSFPGHGKVERQLERATWALSLVERVLGSLPVRGGRAELAARVEDRRSQAERALGYVQLYGSYTETEARFRVDHLLALAARLAPGDARTFCLDPAVIDWERYVHEVHLPSVVEHARVRSKPGRSTSPSRKARAAKAILSPDRHLAAFDLENTLVASNVVESYAWLAGRHLPAAERVALSARHTARSAATSRSRPPRPRRLPAELLPPLRGRAARAPGDGRGGAAARPVDQQVVSGGLRPRARAPRARPSNGPHHRSARLRGRAPPPALRRNRVRLTRRRRRRAPHGKTLTPATHR